MRQTHWSGGVSVSVIFTNKSPEHKLYTLSNGTCLSMVYVVRIVVEMNEKLIIDTHHPHTHTYISVKDAYGRKPVRERRVNSFLAHFIHVNKTSTNIRCHNDIGLGRIKV